MNWTKCWFLFHDYECIYHRVVMSHKQTQPDGSIDEVITGEGMSYYFLCRRCGKRLERGDGLP
jgi:hypothetical protein